MYGHLDFMYFFLLAVEVGVEPEQLTVKSGNNAISFDVFRIFFNCDLIVIVIAYFKCSLSQF